jgi:hypothetical protein
MFLAGWHRMDPCEEYETSYNVVLKTYKDLEYFVLLTPGP